MTTYESLSEAIPALRSLEWFPGIPEEGSVTIGELNGVLRTVESWSSSKPFNPAKCIPILEHYIPISAEIVNPIKSRKSMKSMKSSKEIVLIKSDEKGFKALWAEWRENGFFGCSNQLQELGAPKPIVTGLNVSYSILTRIANIKTSIKTAIFPHLKLTNEEMVDTFSTVVDYSEAWIRSMAWHPNRPLLALGFRDDSIKLYMNTPIADVSPSLKAPEQKLLCGMSWHPYENILAVGVEPGVIIWNVHTNWKGGHPDSELIAVSGHSPVTSVEFSFTGTQLITSSPADTSFIIWQLHNWKYIPFSRIRGGGVPMCGWPLYTTTKIFTTSPGSTFRLWSHHPEKNYQTTNWETAGEPVDTFAWNSKGNFVTFVSDSVMFALSTPISRVEIECSYELPHEVIPIYDLHQMDIPVGNSNDTYKVGGKVKKMEWDNSGTRLAVLFESSPVLALFRMASQSNISIAPIGFIRGYKGEYPVTMSFQRGFANGELLSIAWSSERIQHFPFVESDFNGLTEDIGADLYSTQVEYEKGKSFSSAFSFTGGNLMDDSSKLDNNGGEKEGQGVRVRLFSSVSRSNLGN